MDPGILLLLLTGPRSSFLMTPWVPGSLACCCLFPAVIPGRCNRQGPITKSPSEGETTGFFGRRYSPFKPKQNGAGQKLGAPVQVTSDFWSGFLPFKPKRNGASQRVGAPVQVTEQVLGEDSVHL